MKGIRGIVLGGILVAAVIFIPGCSMSAQLKEDNESLTIKRAELENTVEYLKKDIEQLRLQIDEQHRLDELHSGREMIKDATCDDVSVSGLVFDGKAFEADIHGNSDFNGLYTPGDTYDGVEEGAAGSRYWSVRDKFNVWHTFRYNASE